jgi:ribosomal protein S18 acetylase RimI-like enzyme
MLGVRLLLPCRKHYTGPRPSSRGPRPSERARLTGMLGSLLIRRLLPEEIGAVGAVLGLARLDQGDGFYLVAWAHDQPIGHLHLAVTDPPELQDVVVRSGFRRRGVARQLTDAAGQEARSLGFTRLRLSVGIDNVAAHALYRSCGFLDVGVPARRVQGTVQIRTGPIEVDDTLLTWEKTL